MTEHTPLALSPAFDRLIQDHLTMARRERSTSSTDWVAVYSLDVKMLYNRLRALETQLARAHAELNALQARAGADAEGD